MSTRGECHVNLSFDEDPGDSVVFEEAPKNEERQSGMHNNGSLVLKSEKDNLNSGVNSTFAAPTDGDDGGKDDRSLSSLIPTRYKDSLVSFLHLEKDASGMIRRCAVVLGILLYASYVIGAVLLAKTEATSFSFWCDGAGLLVVVTALVTFALLYHKILKPRCFGKIRSRARTLVSQIRKVLESRPRVKWLVLGILGLAVLAFLVVDTRDERERLLSAFGTSIILAFGYLFSAAPRKVKWGIVTKGVLLQFAMALLILRWNVGRAIFRCLGRKVNDFLGFTDYGTKFVFGHLTDPKDLFFLNCTNDSLKGAEILASCDLKPVLAVLAFKVFRSDDWHKIAFMNPLMAVLARQVLMVILFVSFAIQILYYYGVMQAVIVNLGWFLQTVIGTTACESVNSAANIFLGMTESPLLIKPFLPLMTRSELHAVMTGGFATVAGSVLAAYISFGISASHLLSASVISAPAALAFSKLFYPETEKSLTSAKNLVAPKSEEVNALHAGITGVMNAIPLVAIIGANLVAFIAFIAFFNAVFNWSCLLVSIPDQTCTLESIFGYIFMPVAWVMGVKWSECKLVGELIGMKTMINEFVAYKELSEIKDKLSERAVIISTYALCGFSNIGSIGIQLGGLGMMAPERRVDLVKVALRAMIAGSCACFLTACTAGVLISSRN